MGLKRRASAVEIIEPLVEFLNVDLELESPSELTSLVSALGGVFVLHSTDEPPYVANLELEDDANLDMLATATKLVELVESLTGDARRSWNRCTTRRFSIGIQSGLAPRSVEYDIPTDLLTRLARCGASLNLTIYGGRYLETSDA